MMTSENNNLKKRKILFLWLNDKEFYAINASRRGVKTAKVFKDVSLILKGVRRLLIMFKLPGISIWLENWKADLKEYNTIIIHASRLVPPVVKYIRGKNKNIRIIVWYWNPVDKCVSPKSFAGYNVELWSFDEADAIKYDLRQNSQYYFNDIGLKETGILYDVFFVGGDKGRIEALIHLEQEIQRMEMSVYFHITNSQRQAFFFKFGNKFKDYYKERISYDEILTYISKSKTILDYVSEKQTGMTIRPLEALFFRKKLLTNDRSIVNRDFYKKENIFVIGIDDLKNLPYFLSYPYIELEKETRDYYDFNQWLERFF